MSNPSFMNHINQMSQNNSFDNMSECLLMEHIQAISFAIDDLRLFLDTHPCDKEALAYMKILMKIRHQAVMAYTKKYGPLYSYMVA